MYFDDRERLQDVERRLLFSTNSVLGKNNNDNINVVDGRRRNSNSNNTEDDDNTDTPWITSLSDEKRSALENFIGYNNPKSVLNLTDEQVEEKTLRWVVDTDSILSPGDDEDDDDNEKSSSSQQRMAAVKYDSIKDLLVASSCHSTLECITFLWNAIADGLEDEISNNQFSTSSTTKNSNSATAAAVKLIVFPNSKSLWNYNTIVTMLEAVQIAMPFLPTELDLRLDLFHPNFKHSPKMWSPQWHSPFPTVGITITTKKKNLQNHPSMIDDELDIDDIDIDAIRRKLDILFESVEVTRNDAHQQHHQFNNKVNYLQVLEDCREWLMMKVEYDNDKEGQTEESNKSNEANDIDWIVQSGESSPLELYRTLWNSALKISSSASSLRKKNNKKEEFGSSSSIIINPLLDSLTLHRVAVTVNAAFRKLHIPVRITQVYHPFAVTAMTRRQQQAGSSNNRKINKMHRPPYGMIQLSLADRSD